MLKDILGTISARYLIAFLNLILIFINAKVLGLEGVGIIGLILASINIIVMFNSILSGNTIVYFMNRYSLQLILTIAVPWIFAGSVIACSFMYFISFILPGYFWHILLLSILYSFVTLTARILLGNENVKEFNLISILQGGLLFIILIFFYYVLAQKEVISYIKSLYIANGIACFTGIYLVLRILFAKKKEEMQRGKKLTAIFKEMFSYGLWSSSDNLAEAFTIRLNYFLLERFCGLNSVGILDAGTKIAESVWNISRSIGFIEYSQIAKTIHTQQQKEITLKLFKTTLVAITGVMACILLIPEWVYTDYLFSKDFAGVRTIIIVLSLGIIANGCNTIISHYFIGSSKVKYSAATSFTGLTVLLITGIILIPMYGAIGSALSNSIAFIAMLLFSITHFMKQTDTCFKELIPTKEDIGLLINKLEQLVKKK